MIESTEAHGDATNMYLLLRLSLTLVPVAWLSVAGCALALAGEADLLATVRARHRASLESIRSISCELLTTTEPDRGAGVEKAKYWQSGESIRCQFEHNFFKEDALIRGPRLVHVRTLAGSKAPRGLISQSHGYSLMPSPWAAGLCRHLSEERAILSTFDEILGKPYRLHSAKSVRENGRDLVHIRISHKGGDVQLWFDPRVNYLVAKSVRGREPILAEDTVQEFKEVKPGIFFPVLIRSVARDAGKVFSTSTTTISRIDINGQMPSDIFDLRFPPGILVSDSFKNALFKTDAKGEPTLAPTNSKGMPVSVGNAPPLASPETTPRHATVEESRPWSWWLLPASVALLVVGGSLWLFQKWRKGRRAETAAHK
jgi:hypothetical protein